MPRANDRPSPATRLVVGALLIFLVGAAIGWAARGGSPGSATDVSPTTESPIEAAPLGSAGETSLSETAPAATLPPGCEPVDDATAVEVAIDALPPEALDTLQNIADGPPFPFGKDGSVFQNREQLLPDHERGYYREYTVDTPGSDDRGARRIVAGECGEQWYTDDHYESFRLIEGGT